MEEAALPMIRSGYFRSETKCRRTKDESRSAFRPADIPNGFLDHHGSGGGFYFGGDSVGAVAGMAEDRRGGRGRERKQIPRPSALRAHRFRMTTKSKSAGAGWLECEERRKQGSKGSRGSRGSSSNSTSLRSLRDDNEKLKLKAKRQRKTRGIGYE